MKNNTTSMQSLKTYVHVHVNTTVYKQRFRKNRINFESFSKQ